MVSYYTEAQQLEILKSWWHSYKRLILITAIAILLALGGWVWRSQQRAAALSNASVIYESLLNQLGQENRVQVQTYANDLIRHYPRSIYAQMAALILAREAVYEGDQMQAQQQLRWVISNGDNPVIKQIARIRLARVLLYDEKSEEALASLATIDDEAYSGLIHEAEGDIFAYQGEVQKAREAYTQALSDYLQPEQQSLLQLKLNNLPQA